MTFLNKEKLTEELNKTSMIAQHIDCMDLFDAINNSVAENVAEIVRCKDCKNGVIYCDNGDIICDHVDSNGNDTHPADWFCADGKRK